MAESLPSICARSCELLRKCPGFCTRRSDSLDEGDVGEKDNLLDSTETPEKEPFKIFDDEEEADDAYDMSHQSRGMAVIFNHYSYLDKLPRVGTHLDEFSLRKCLHHLGFEYSSVEVCLDFSRQKILDKLFALSQKDFSNYSCLFVAVMTHGWKDTGMLCAADLLYRPEELWQPFESSPSLEGKPKLFFIQACRGGSLDNGVWVQTRSPTRKISTGLRGDMGLDASAGLNLGGASEQKEEEESGSGDANGNPVEDKSNAFKVPVDVLVAYSSPPGYASFLDPESGSFFVQNLCRLLLAEAATKDLVSLLTKVNRDVAVRCESYSSRWHLHEKKQAPCFVTGLTKRLVFTPK